MSSQINSEKINEEFPVAGEDNDSSGFRDNFQLIKNGLSTAATEITELQDKVLLKSALGSTGVATNDLNGSNISNGTHTNFHGTSYVSSQVSNVASILINNGPLQIFTLTDDTTFTFREWPLSGQYANVRIHFINNGSAISVGNEIKYGKRYTIQSVGNTDFYEMGAQPTVQFTGTVAGNELTVTSVKFGEITTGTTITTLSGDLIPGEVTVLGAGSQPGKYFLSEAVIPSISVNTEMRGISPGVVFTVNLGNSRGTGSGTVKPWREVTLRTENSGEVIFDAEFSLPLQLNPNGAHQVVEAWSWTGNKVYVSYIGNIDNGSVNYTVLNVGDINVGNNTSSVSPTTGALVVAGGAGIARDLNIGGDAVIKGNLSVEGSLQIDISNVTTTYGNLTDIEDVRIPIDELVDGDVLRWDSTIPGQLGGPGWTTNYDLTTYYVTIDDNGSNVDPDPVFHLNQLGEDPTPISNWDGSIQYKLNFVVGKKYRFDLSNSLYNLRFTTTPDFDSSVLPSQEYIKSVRKARDPSTNEVLGAGTAGAYIEILITDETPSPLYVYAEPSVGVNTDLYGAAYPIQVGSNGPVSVYKDYIALGSQSILVDTKYLATNNLDPITITLPVNETARPLLPGTTIVISNNGNVQDLYNPSNNKPITIKRGDNAATINGVTSDVVINGNFSAWTLVCDGGTPTNWTAIQSSYNGQEQVTPATSTVSPNVSVSWFSTSASESASLGAGSEGQIKVLAMKGDSGDMEVSVVNAAWRPDGSSGTITFNDIGDSCILQYVSDKWFIVGNNGCDFDGVVTSQNLASIVDPPAGQTAEGLPGQISFDSSFFYVCIAPNTWYSVQFQNTVVPVPLTPTSSGAAGQVAFGGGYTYFATDTNSWVRTWTENNFDKTSVMLKNVSPPNNPSDIGIAGWVAYDNNYLYICVGSNSWKRIAYDVWS